MFAEHYNNGMSEYNLTQTIMGFSFTALFVALGLFVASLFLPVFVIEYKVVLGYWVLATGWLGFIGFQFAWYANAFALFTLYFSRKQTLFALFLSFMTLLIASQAYLFTEAFYSEKRQVVDYESGFYIWYLSFYFLAAAILLRLIANVTHKAQLEKIEALTQQKIIKAQAEQQEETIEASGEELRPRVVQSDTSLPPPLPFQNKKTVPPSLPE